MHRSVPDARGKVCTRTTTLSLNKQHPPPTGLPRPQPPRRRPCPPPVLSSLSFIFPRWDSPLRDGSGLLAVFLQWPPLGVGAELLVGPRLVFRSVEGKEQTSLLPARTDALGVHFIPRIFHLLHEQPPRTTRLETMSSSYSLDMSDLNSLLMSPSQGWILGIKPPGMRNSVVFDSSIAFLHKSVLCTVWSSHASSEYG